MARNPCPKVACPVIRIKCTNAQKARKKCYVKVGKTVYHTKTNTRTGQKVGALIRAQKRMRCMPKVVSSGTGVAQAQARALAAQARAASKAAMAASNKRRREQIKIAKREREASLKALRRDCRDRNKQIAAQYKTTLSKRA